jgi:hypothetical protein
MALVGHADANMHALLNTRKIFLCIQPARSANKPKLSASLWWSRGNAQWLVKQMRVEWRAGFQRLKTGTFG